MVKPRQAKETVSFIDEYCESYRDLFPEVRSYEHFKDLHLGLISDIQRKTFPEMGKVVGLESGQGFDYFIGQSAWSVEEFRKRRLGVIKNLLNGREIILIMDETGDRKKGKTTDYVARQYIGNLGKVENGIVAVTAYGILEGMTFPLLSEVYKPKSRLKDGDEYQSKPEIAAGMIKKLKKEGFRIKLVLADSEYGESASNFISVLRKEELEYVLAIRRNHGVLMVPGERVRVNKWIEFDRVFSTGEKEKRYIREIIFGRKGEIRYWQITKDPETLPKNSTWYVMTKVAGINYKTVGNLYGLKNWVEYGLKQSKNELGWADFRVTEYHRIEKWWEMVMSVYLMVSLQSEVLKEGREELKPMSQYKSAQEKMKKHPYWDEGKGWKSLLNNLRLFIQPLCYFNLLKPWLAVIFTPSLLRLFCRLFFQIMKLTNALLKQIFPGYSYHSST